MKSPRHAFVILRCSARNFDQNELPQNVGCVAQERAIPKYEYLVNLVAQDNCV